MSKNSDNRLFSPIFVLILIVTLFTFLVGQGTNAGTSVYLERTGGELWLAGIGALCFSAAAAVSRLISGATCDTKTRQIVIIAGAAFMLAGCLGPLLNNESGCFLLWRILQGAGFSAATTALATASADVLPMARMGEGIGYYGLGQAVSMAIGPALAIFLVSTDPPSNFYLGCASCSALALIGAFVIRYERDHTALPESSAYRQRMEEILSGNDGACHDKETNESLGFKGFMHATVELRALHGAIPIAFLCSLFSFNTFYMGVFGNAIGSDNPGYYYMVCAVAMIIVRLVSGRFMDTAPLLAIMGVAAGCGVVASLMLFISSGLSMTPTAEWLFYGSGIFVGVSMGIGIPVNQTVAVKMSPQDRWGAANGFFQLAIDVANGTLSVVWGFLATSIGYQAVSLCILGCIILSFVSSMITYPKEPRERTESR